MNFVSLHRFRSLSSKGCLCSPNIRKQFQLSTRGMTQGIGDKSMEAEDRYDDEFIFPVQLFSPTTKHKWLWSGSELSQHCDLAAESFFPERNVLYSTDSVKIFNVKHKTHGDVVFTMVKDQFSLWKICSAAIFGEIASTDETMPSHTINSVLGGLLNHLNDKKQTLWKPSTQKSDVFSRPYQYVCPPFSIKFNDAIGKVIKLPEDDRDESLPSCFKMPVQNSERQISTNLQNELNLEQNTLMISNKLALVSFDVYAYDRLQSIDTIYEMLAYLEFCSDDAQQEQVFNAKIASLIIGKEIRREAGNN